MHILVADDDPSSVKYTAFLLEEAGYRVLKAYDGLNTLQSLDQHQPDLVLLDVVMPKTSGFDICRRIRRSSDVPIIFLSCRTELQDKVTGLQIGADDYLAKPVEPAELLARVQAVLRRHKRTSAHLTYGDITLDPVKHTVVFANTRTVVLTPLEFRLLHYLIQNAGHVLSASQILNRVWGYDFMGESNLVAVYIRRLRAKVESNPDVPRHILTVRNLGYRYEH